MKCIVQIHKRSGRRGAIVRADSGQQWGPGDLAEFDFVTVDLTDEQVADLRDERKRLLPDKTLVEVPEAEWPERRAEVERVRMQLDLAWLEQRYGHEAALKIIREAAGLLE